MSTDPTGACVGWMWRDPTCQFIGRGQVRRGNLAWAEGRPGGAAIDFVPVVGDIKGLIEVFTGCDLVTGEDLGAWRWAGLLFLGELRQLRHADTVVGALRVGADDVIGALRMGDAAHGVRQSRGNLANSAYLSRSLINNPTSRALQSYGIPHLKSGKLTRTMSRSPIGRRVVEAARSGDIALELSDEKVNRTLLGESGRFGSQGYAIVYVRNTQSYRLTAATLVHEGLHALGIGGSRRAEALVRLAELEHLGAAIDRAAMRQVLINMRSFPEDYGHLPWRIGGKSPHFPDVEF